MKRLVSSFLSGV